MIKTGVFCRSSFLNFGRYCVVTSHRDVSQIKMTKMLNKMLSKDKKKKWYKNPVVGGSSGAGFKRGPSEGAKRRADQVSKFLYDHISNIVNSGELSSELPDMAVDIVKVKMAPDFSGINVYWAGSGSETDTKLEELLKQHEGKLREILISYHILGTTPMVTFVCNKSSYKFKDVESLLKNADFGPDFEPTTDGTSIRPNPLLELGQVDSVSNEFKNLSFDFLHSSDSSNVIRLDRSRSAVDHRFAGNERDCEEQRQEMFDGRETNPDHPHSGNLNFRNDLYGLPREDIMRKLMMKKQKTKYRTLVTENENPKDSVSKEAYQRHIKKFESRKQSGKKKQMHMIQNDMNEPHGDHWHVDEMWSDEAYESDLDNDFDTSDDDSDHKQRK